MKKLIKGRGKPHQGSIITAIWILVVVGSLCTVTLQAANRVVLDVVMEGTSTPVDTIYTDYDYELRIHVENDFPLCAIMIPVKVFYNGDPGLVCYWNAQPGGYGATEAVTVPKGCRLDPVSVFTLYFGAHEWDMDEVLPDSISIGGTSGDTIDTLGGGPLEHMFSLHFTPTAPDDDIIRYLCVNQFPSSINPLLFVDCAATGITPQLNGVCWPVVNRNPDNGDVNCDDQINVGDAVYLINYVFKYGPPPCQ